MGVLPILKKNLSKLQFLDNYLIIEKNILINFDFKIFKEKFDLIFIDPPYKENDLTKLLISILENKVLKRGGIIIIHRHKDQKDIFPETFKIIEEKKYGKSKITFGSYY